MTVLPVWLLAGGPGSDKTRITRLMADALSTAPRPRPAVAYLGAASDDDAGFLARIGSLLRQAGAGSVTLAPTCGPRARPDSARSILEKADVIFVSGGDVEAGMAVLHDQALPPVLRDLQEEGKLFIGLSAGSIMLGRGWVRWPDPDDDDSAVAFACLGLAPVYCDTHAEEDDWEELHTLMRLLPPGAGYGIPTRAALRVDPDGSVHVFGDAVFRLEHLKGGKYRSCLLSPRRADGAP